MRNWRARYQPRSFASVSAARTAPEVTGWGTGGTLTGAGRMIKAARPETKIIDVVVGAERHGTIDRALRMLGFGTRHVGVCFPSVTTWQGSAGLRISLSNWSTDEDDVRRSVAAIARVHGATSPRL